MASLRYLIRNRAHFSVASKSFYKAWVKRVLTLPELINRNQRRVNLSIKGANINCTAELSKATIGGNKTNLTIGEFTFLGRVNMALHDCITIGSYVVINDGAQLLTASHDINHSQWLPIKKPIIISDFVWIATNAIILPGVHIGYGAVVGAGAVVSKDVLPYQIVIGNPAQPISKKRTEHLNYNPCEFLAANSAWIKG